MRVAMHDTFLSPRYRVLVDAVEPLTPDEMAHLARIAQGAAQCVAEGQQQDARQQACETLMRHNLRLVATLAQRYARACDTLTADDLMSEGVIGLLRAIRDWQPERATFATYALPWIRQAILRAIENQEGLIRTPTYAHTRRRQALRRRDATRAALGHEPTLAEMRAAGLTSEEELALRYAAPRIGSLDEPALRRARTGDVAASADDTLGDRVADASDDADVAARVERRTAQEAQTKRIQRAMRSALDAREARVVAWRFGLTWEPQERQASQQAQDWSLATAEGLSLQEIAARLGISRERVRQIEMAALEKLRQALAAPQAKTPTKTPKAPKQAKTSKQAQQAQQRRSQR